MLKYTSDLSFDPRAVTKHQKSGWQVYGRLVRYALQYKARVAITMVFAILVAASFSSMIISVGAAVRIVYGDEATVQQQVPYVVDRIDTPLRLFVADPEAWAFDLVETMRSDRVRAVTIVASVLLCLVIFMGLARFLQEYLAGTIGADITVGLAREMFKNIMRLSLPFYEKRDTGDILARFTNDIFMVNRGLVGAFEKLLREPVKALFLLIVALSMHVWLTLAVLIVFPLTGYVILRIGKKIRKFVRRSLEKIASMVTVGAESISGIMIIKAFEMEQHKVAQVREELRKLRRHLVKMVQANAAVGPATEIMLVLGLVAFMLLAARAVEVGQLDGASLVVLFGSLAAMMDPVRKLSSVNNLIQTSIASAERIFEFIDIEPDIKDAPNAKTLQPVQDAIRFEDVHFSYDGKTDVLRGIDLEIRKGEMVALVGFSGAGKSTMAKLLPRFYDVTAGRISIDGVDIRDATLTSLRAQIGVVTQETILFNETVRENIAAGSDRYVTDLIVEAARAANAMEFIEKLPEGIDTKLGGEGGTNLSGGQRQRIAIARAIVKDPAILILDEATSNLDSESERAIQEALDKFVANRTTLVIAHRLSTVQRADRIVVMADGKIIEVGSHSELLDKNGTYRRLYETQFRTGAESA